MQKKGIIIKTYYLIDYENVGCEGMKGCEKLGLTDFIHLFYTDNSRKIDLDIINDHGEAHLITHKVAAGKQSADMHLGSYLGFLIGKEYSDQEEECRFVVVSKDTGFDHMIRFWKTEKDVKIFRSEKISGKQIQTKKSAGKQTEKKTSKVIAMDSGEKKLQEELGLILNKAGMSEEVVNYVSLTVGKNADDKNKKQRIYRSIISKYGQEKGLNIYNYIRKRI